MSEISEDCLTVTSKSWERFISSVWVLVKKLIFVYGERKWVSSENEIEEDVKRWEWRGSIYLRWLLDFPLAVGCSVEKPRHRGAWGSDRSTVCAV